MLKNFIKNPLLIVVIIFAASLAVGVAVVFVYKQPNSSDLTASIASDKVSEVNQTKPQETSESAVISEPVVEGTAQEEPQSSTQPQIQGEPKVVSKEEPKVVSKPKVIKPAPVEETAPNTQLVIASPPSIRAGESVTITVSTPGFEDVSSVSFIDVYLGSPTGLNNARGTIVSIDGEGRRFGSIAIPQDAELGTWLVKTVQIFDNTGGITSYHYGTDIFTTFTVVAAQ